MINWQSWLNLQFLRYWYYPGRSLGGFSGQIAKAKRTNDAKTANLTTFVDLLGDSNGEHVYRIIFAVNYGPDATRTKKASEMYCIFMFFFSEIGALCHFLSEPSWCISILWLATLISVFLRSCLFVSCNFSVIGVTITITNTLWVLNCVCVAAWIMYFGPGV